MLDIIGEDNFEVGEGFVEEVTTRNLPSGPNIHKLARGPDHCGLRKGFHLKIRPNAKIHVYARPDTCPGDIVQLLLSEHILFGISQTCAIPKIHMCIYKKYCRCRRGRLERRR